MFTMPIGVTDSYVVLNLSVILRFSMIFSDKSGRNGCAFISLVISLFKLKHRVAI